MLLYGLGLLLASASMIGAGPILVQPRQEAVVAVLDALSLYETASGDCAVFLHSKYRTTTSTVFPSVTTTLPATTVRSTVTVTAESLETKTSTLYEEDYSYSTITSGMRTSTIFPVTETLIVTEVSLTRLTSSIPDPGNVITLTTTRGYRESVVTRTVWKTVPTATATVFANKVPTALSAFQAADVKAACSIFISAPIPKPYTTTTEVGRTSTLTAYETTASTVVTSSVTAVTVLVTTTESFTLPSIVPSSTFLITATRTTTSTTAVSSTLQLTRKIRQTRYSTVRVPTLRTTKTATATTFGTATVTMPVICETKRAASSIFVSGGKAVSKEVDSTDSREACCAKCEETAGCVYYQWYTLGQCYVATVTEANGKGSLKSGQCPLGSLEGRFTAGSTGVYGVGSCWNGPD